jgi:hypothetical protein
MSTTKPSIARSPVQRLVRRVFFTMVLYPHTGKWTRVGKAYSSKAEAKSWLPLVRGAWRGCRVKVTPCTLRWINGTMTQASKDTLSVKFNMEPPKDTTNEALNRRNETETA